jgi:MoaA/NifB/PqqE/SkfB family radical SAM enzyme
LEEWEKIFRSLGKNLFWATISGGEPFLRNDIVEIVGALYDHCKPSIINIPTNGLLKERIPDVVKKITQHCKSAQIIINLSIDDIGDKHDAIRGIPGSYARVLDTFAALKSLNISNLSVGIHTVISKFNVGRIPEIYRHLRTLCPDSYITEIAEEREELDTIGAGISPEYSDYARAVDFLANELKSDHFNRVGKITRAFRMKYYEITKKILREHRQVIPCYAGFASAQIAPDGEVWMCCVKAKSIGNLRDVGYDFSKVWFSTKAEELRTSIKKKECFCPLANAAYTNMLHDMKTMTRISLNLITMSRHG